MKRSVGIAFVWMSHGRSPWHLHFRKMLEHFPATCQEQVGAKSVPPISLSKRMRLPHAQRAWSPAQTFYGIAWDGLFPVSGLTLTGELYWGKNLNMFFSKAGVRNRGNAGEKEQEAMGGRFQVNAGIGDRIELNDGYGVEDIEDRDIDPGIVSRNSTVFANVIYSLSKNLKFAFEPGYIRTQYKSRGDEDRSL